MECLRRAALERRTFAGRDVNLKHAAKLPAIYTSQMDALNKHRGKGQQKVTVEHVHIESGTQAIIGNVLAGDKAAVHEQPVIRRGPAWVRHLARQKLANPLPLDVRQFASLDHRPAPNHTLRNEMNQRSSGLRI